MSIVYFLSGINQLAQTTDSPQTHHLGKRIIKDISAIAILNQLAKSSLHHFIAKNSVSQQRMLFCREHTHRIGYHLPSHLLFISLGKYMDKGIHPIGSRLTQSSICHFYHIELFSSLLI